MNAVTMEKEQALRAQIDDAQGQLGQLEQDLAVVESELQNLMTQRERYESLAQVCDSLAKLESVGAAELFWGDGGPNEDRVRFARQRIEDFNERVKAVSENRQVVVGRLAEGRGVLAILEDDWFELQEQEEERRNEWVIEREVGAAADRPPTMPWARGSEDDQRFRKSVGSALLAALLLGVLLPLIPLPIPKPTDVIEVPERLVELIRQERRIPPPPPAIQERKPEQKKQTEPEPKPEEKVAEQQPKEAVKPEDKPPGPASPPEEAPRQRARASGILAFSESFAKLANDQPAARLGSAARINNTGEAAIGRPERSMITTQAPGSSGGINLAALSRGVGGGGAGGPALAGVATTRVESSIGPGGGGGGAGAGHGTGGAGGLAGRTDEEIQIVFDRYKASLYRLYNRELRKTPTLQGQVILKLTIEPDGSVSLCQLESTDMDAQELVQQVIERVRLFDFGAKDVAAVTIVYPIDFLPAA
jgi:outer membrane biosynthesis protein TonB